MKVLIGSDRAGFHLKNALVEYLTEKGYAVEDIGTRSLEQVKSHNEVGFDAAKRIREDPSARGILICGTGMGMAIAANKTKGIYAACVESVYAARYARLINDASILCFGAFVVGEGMAKEMVDAFLETDFVQDFPQWRIDYLTGQKELLQKLEDQTF